MPRNPDAAKDNPCLKEQELSYKCLSKHNYDREVCSAYFANYNGCREFWNRVRADRRAKGIVPNMPAMEDRERIKDEYKNRH